MKRQRIPTVVLCALCLITVIGVGWFVINRSGVPAAHENEDGHAVERNADAAPKDHGEANVVLKRASDLPGGQMREEFGGGELARLPIREPLPYRIRHAVTYGAKAKITLRVADSKGVPVADALVGGGFYNHDEKGHDFKERTNEKGEVTLEDTCVGDLNFGVMKDGYYSTGTTYWFFKNYFDCVKDGRWIPWNPTVEIVLKEMRNPIKMIKNNSLLLAFPMRENVGFDLEVGDVVAPFGAGKESDVSFYFDSWQHFNPYCYSNRFVITVGNGGSIATAHEDSFSAFKFAYAPPDSGWASDLTLGMVRTKDKILRDVSLGKEEYWVVAVRRGDKKRFAVVSDFEFGGSDRGTNYCGVLLSYYLNPNPGDTNLEIKGHYP